MKPTSSMGLNHAKKNIHTCVKKLVLEVIHGNSCVCVENLVPMMVTDISCLKFFKTSLAILTILSIEIF